MQHTKLPWPSPTPRVCSSSCPLSNPTTSSSVFPFSSYFNLSQYQSLFQWGGQSIGVSVSASVLPVNNQSWFPLGLTGWISLQSKALSGVFSNTIVQKHQFLGAQLSLWSNSHIHTWPLEKPKLWLDRPFLAKWYLCFLICCLGLSWRREWHNLLQYSCLENSMDRGAWWATVHGVTKSRIWLCLCVLNCNFLQF